MTMHLLPYNFQIGSHVTCKFLKIAAKQVFHTKKECSLWLFSLSLNLFSDRLRGEKTHAYDLVVVL